jgi:hypothetical protein
LCGQKKVTKEKPPRLAAPFGGSLRCSSRWAAPELALAAARQGLRQSSPTPRGVTALLGSSQWVALRFATARMMRTDFGYSLSRCQAMVFAPVFAGLKSQKYRVVNCFIKKNYNLI